MSCVAPLLADVSWAFCVMFLSMFFRGMMYLKAAVMIVFLAAVGAGMLSLRQQRWEVRHSIAQMHRQIEQARRATWESQAKVAAELHPAKLEHKLMIARIEMDPITASHDPALRRIRVMEKAAPQPAMKTRSNVKTSTVKSKTKRNI